MKRAVLISGYAGFLGLNLTKKMIAQGYTVVGVDDFSNTAALQTTLQEIERFAKQERVFPIHPMNCTNEKILELIPRKFCIEYVFHLASLASPIQYKAKPLHTMEANSTGTANMLKIADAYEATLVYASTSEVYGQADAANHPQKEDYNGNVSLFGSRASYDQAKRFGETLVRVSNETNKTKHKVARIFNTYGPYMAPGDGRVVSTLLTQVLRNQPLTVFGGEQTRTMGFVDDTIDGLWHIAGSHEFDTYNVGGETEITMHDLAKFIVDTFDPGRRIDLSPFDGEEPMRRKPDLTRLKSLGWTPKVGLEEGLKRTLEWLHELQKKRIL